nr:hypothetical protein [Actinomycetota bacterium]
AGLPTVCSETCVGRLRYLGIVLYDADRVTRAAATADPAALYEAQLELLLDPEDPEVERNAEESGIPYDWIAAARRSPAYALIARHRVALPLHPEFRTMPMVWYVPPLSPISDATASVGGNPENPADVFATIDAMRIPLEYLASLFSAGDVEPVRRSLLKLAAVRTVMRAEQLGFSAGVVAAGAGMDVSEARDLFKLLAIARYEDRFVVPPTHAEQAGRLLAQHDLSGCSLESSGGCGDESDVTSSHVDGPSRRERDSRGRLHLEMLELGPGLEPGGAW